MSPELQAWLSEPPPVDVGRALERLCRADDVVHVAVMPDVHLAEEVCVGVVVTTTRLLGCAAALCTSSHGAGRAMSRQEARRRVRIADLNAQVAGVWYDHRKAGRLVEEAPAAYKDITKVMRAQGELVRIERRLQPLLSFKGV